MAKYVMWGSYCENVLEKRAPYRQAHLDGLTAQKESGVLITIGPPLTTVHPLIFQHQSVRSST
ncbi:MAG: hypothetical protein F6J92_01870 [Symploca sp. SIO1A3]|nr:hypothetical protein [Symploca sp. SIO1A3]